jgi:hypothetical protein
VLARAPCSCTGAVESVALLRSALFKKCVAVTAYFELLNCSTLPFGWCPGRGHQPRGSKEWQSSQFRCFPRAAYASGRGPCHTLRAVGRVHFPVGVNSGLLLPRFGPRATQRAKGQASGQGPRAAGHGPSAAGQGPSRAKGRVRALCHSAFAPLVFAMWCACHLSGGVHKGTLPEGECEYGGMFTPHVTCTACRCCLCMSHVASLSQRGSSVRKSHVAHNRARMVAEPSVTTPP